VWAFWHKNEDGNGLFLCQIACRAMREATLGGFITLASREMCLGGLLVEMLLGCDLIGGSGF